MSTSKIGKVIKTRDVVTPGFSDAQKNQPDNHFKQQLDSMLKICESLELKYQNQKTKVLDLTEKLNELQMKNLSKEKIISNIKKELDDKNFLLGQISQKVSQLETKLDFLQVRCDELLKALNKPEKVEPSSSWNFFKGKEHGS